MKYMRLVFCFCGVLLLTACGKGLVDETYTIKVIGLEPATGPMAGGSFIKLYGQNLNGNMVLKLGGKAIPTYSLESDSTISFRLPKAPMPGPVELVVHNPSTNQNWRKEEGFRYRATTLEFGSGLGGASIFSSFAVADWNGDGIKDIACAFCRDSSLALYVSGKGHYVLKSKHVIPWRVDFRHRSSSSHVAAIRLSLVVGDFSGDGILDVVAAYTDSTDLLLFRGRADHTLSKPETIATNGNLQMYKMRKMIAMDLDKDGRSELVIFNQRPTGVQDVAPDLLDSLVIISGVGSEKPGFKAHLGGELRCPKLHAKSRTIEPNTLRLLCQTSQDHLEDVTWELSKAGVIETKRKRLRQTPIAKDARYYFLSDADQLQMEYGFLYEINKSEGSVCMQRSFDPAELVVPKDRASCVHKLSSGDEGRGLWRLDSLHKNGERGWFQIQAKKNIIKWFSYPKNDETLRERTWPYAPPNRERLSIIDWSKSSATDALRADVLWTDLDGDGVIDLIAPTISTLALILYGGETQFSPFPTLQSANPPNHKDSGYYWDHSAFSHKIDLNGDGRMDTVTRMSRTNKASSRAELLLGVQLGGTQPASMKWNILADDALYFPEDNAAFAHDFRVFFIQGSKTSKDIVVVAWEGFPREGSFLLLRLTADKGKYVVKQRHRYRVQRWNSIYQIERKGEDLLLSMVQTSESKGKSSAVFSVLTLGPQLKRKDTKVTRVEFPVLGVVGEDLDGDGSPELLSMTGKLYCSGARLKECERKENWRSFCPDGACSVLYIPNAAPLSVEDRWHHKDGKVHERSVFLTMFPEPKLKWVVFRNGKKHRETVINFPVQLEWLSLEHGMYCDIDGDGQKEPILVSQTHSYEAATLWGLFQKADQSVEAVRLAWTGLRSSSLLLSLECVKRKNDTRHDIGFWYRSDFVDVGVGYGLLRNQSR